MKARILDEKRIKSTTKTVVFVHGSYAVGNSVKNVAAAERICQEGIASTVLYESSRDWVRCASARTMQDWIAAFHGKTYHDELADLRGVLEHIRSTQRPTEIYLSGTSYGAGLALLVADEVPGITRILLSAPQISAPHRENGPIYEGFPTLMKFGAVLRRYSGRLTVLIGSEDSKERWHDAHHIIRNAATDKKELSVIYANHNFGDEPENPTARWMYTEEHVHAFR